MQKREKIIVSMVIIAAIYGAVDFTLNSQKKELADLAVQPDSQAIAELAAQLGPLSSADNQKIARLAASINEPWPEEVFVLRQTDFGNDKQIEKTKGPDINNLRNQADQLIYSGFLSMGTDRIAIINGMDYRIGEQINGFTITKINPESIQVSLQEAFFDIAASTEAAPALSTDKAPQP